ncbi:MAG: 4Fe-4S dicluster domain-containing protein [Pseudomonadota bacterium]|nr:4Fe-4S dicluster domain-containing protein [Pseudomonadota bacterium]
MAVKITDTCINCDACLEECPTESIVDNDENPTGEDIYYVNADTCTECVGDHDEPACAEACPTEGCIVWDDSSVAPDQPKSANRGADNTPCVE